MKLAVPIGLYALPLVVTKLGTAEVIGQPYLRHAEKRNKLFETATLGRPKLDNAYLQDTDGLLRGTFQQNDQEPTRRLALLGSETFLAIRVVATGCNPACSNPPTVAKIANDLYEDSYNLVSVVGNCSDGKFTLGPAQTINGNTLATPGVYEVTITQDVNGAEVKDARKYANDELEKPGELGANFMDDADKFIYFFPPELSWPVNPAGNVSPGFASGNTLNLNQGFYDSTCGHVHEYFHTLGLNHATEGGRGATEYEDITGQMGSSVGGDEYCQKCFNGPHNWFLGWYENRHDEISSPGILDASGSYNLVGLDEYGSSTAGQTVVLKIGLGFPDYYVSFNRYTPTGINRHTGEYRNQVLVHTVIANTQDPKDFTDLRDAMNAGDTFAIPGGEIEVVSIDTTTTPAVAQVNVNQIIPSGKLDVFFLIDNTASFLDDIDFYKGIVDDVIQSIQDDADDVHFGLGIFRDYPQGDYGEPGDFPYRLLVPIPVDGAGDGAQDVIDETQDLSPGGGKDAQESQLQALLQAVNGPDDAQFRADAAKFIIVWTDSGFHDSGVEDGYPGASYATVLAALQAAGVPLRERGRGLESPQQSVRVVGIVRPGEDTYDEAVDYLERLATDTSAVAPPGGVDCSGDGSEIIPEGEPIVCKSGTGIGIAPAMTAAVKAVIEVVRPEALCHKGVAVAETGKCSVTYASIDDGSNDPFGGPVNLEQIPGGPYSVGTTPVTLRVTNSEELASYCFNEIEVQDKEPPMLRNLPSSETVECDSIPEPPVVLATDNCVTLLDEPLEVLFEEVRTNGECDFDYTLTRTWTTQDLSGNVATKSILVTVQDTTPPEIECNVHDISPNDANMNDPKEFTMTAEDNCAFVDDTVVQILGYSCTKPNGKEANCKIDYSGSTARIEITGGIGTRIEFQVRATDTCANEVEKTCTLMVVNP